MGSRSRTEDQIVEVAWCYFHDEMNQADSAGRPGISRTTVVNCLAEARARDYVRVSLQPETFSYREVSEELKARSGLRDALVVPVAKDAPGENLDRVARAAADWLPTLLRPGDQLGVSWGETVIRISEAAERITIPDLEIVQMVGSRATPRDLLPKPVRQTSPCGSERIASICTRRWSCKEPTLPIFFGKNRLSSSNSRQFARPEP